MSNQHPKPVVNEKSFLLGNEALSRGALEAGVNYAAGYPGTPSSEIIERFSRVAKQRGMHVEWSTNEKVACEGAAAAAIAGLTSLSAMKNAGLSVALDFLTHLSLTGLSHQQGAMVVVVCDDPDAHSSGDETDSRWQARFAYAPMLEPTSVAEARELIKYGFDLSREYSCYVFLRSYTRLSHGSGILELQPLPTPQPTIANPDPSASVHPYLGRDHHMVALERLEKIKAQFEVSPFNKYEGPESVELLIVASGNGYSCSQEAVDLLQLNDRVGILKLVTIWPFPEALVRHYSQHAKQILVVEEVDPVIEVSVKDALNGTPSAHVEVLGKESGYIPLYGEITPDRVIDALTRIFGKTYSIRSTAYTGKIKKHTENLLVSRGLSWCPGCPHRATFWILNNILKAAKGNIFVTGDIGCYTLDVFPEGKEDMKMLHAMGSSIGLASGLGQLSHFGCDMPVVSICGDSTFFHAVLPGLINAIHNQSNLIQVILDNSSTAMTGFQTHPGVRKNAVGDTAPSIDVVRLCEALGVHVVVADPFDLKITTRIFRELLAQKQGVSILILRHTCELVRMKQEKKKPFKVIVDQTKCKGDACARCYGQFRCPAFVQNPESGKASIREDFCSGCGVCASICPFNAISILEESK